MEEERNYCVYFHENKINGKLYFGITCRSPQIRWGKDGAGYKGSPHFYSAIQKYGWDNFYHIVVKRNLTAEEAGNMEKELIALYKTTEKEFGYNLESGGLFNTKVNDSTKQKLREANLGKKLSEETKQKLSVAHTGKKQSEETKKKRSESIKALEVCLQNLAKAREERKRKVLCVETGVVYDSITDAATDIGVAHASISRVVNKKLKSTHGLHFKFYEEE